VVVVKKALAEGGALARKRGVIRSGQGRGGVQDERKMRKIGTPSIILYFIIIIIITCIAVRRVVVVYIMRRQ